MWREDHPQVGLIRCKGMSEGNIISPSLLACADYYRFPAPMNSIVMAGGSQGRGECLLASFHHCYTLLFLVLCWMVTGATSAKSLWWLGSGSTSPSSAVALGTRPQACVFGLRCVSLVVCSVNNQGAVMPQPRQRMLRRRGSARDAPSRPSSGDAASSQDPRSRCGRGGILRPNEFLKPSSPGSSSSPSLGSTIFTFNCSLNRPWITAHVSVLFLEEAQEEGTPSAPLPFAEEA